MVEEVEYGFQMLFPWHHQVWGKLGYLGRWLCQRVQARRTIATHRFATDKMLRVSAIALAWCPALVNSSKGMVPMIAWPISWSDTPWSGVLSRWRPQPGCFYWSSCPMQWRRLIASRGVFLLPSRTQDLVLNQASSWKNDQHQKVRFGHMVI